MKPTNMKANILAASTKLMAKQGIKNTSLSDIAKEVGISKGTLYYHYSSKDDIICDMADMHLKVITNALIECLQNAGFHSTTEEFVSIILNKISDIENHGRIHMYLICEAVTSNEKLRERFKIKYIEWRKALELEIKRATKFKDDSYPVSFLLISIVDGLVIQSLLKTEQLPYDEISRFLIDSLN
ncbi:MAG: TetR/AcrR family transcriptional regulator [Intestinibacter bartlettii]|uniref:TetR/AcrR family transcriptional regulator n=2 Tax=Intestinibacter bartlettii TaxID=261299 RepID=A0ABS6DVI5_9FIRM|nr:TetR/AcrR family transcriptional regulator [Intestinibacter bartlettii]MDO5010684.1 TetR/AcrR family transcriptional regulator [Intestinibacter bartlettii]